MKMMPHTILYHSPNTTHLAYIGVLDYPAQVYGLSIEGAASRHLIISMTLRSDRVYELSIEGATFVTYYLQNTMYLCLEKHVQK